VGLRAVGADAHLERVSVYEFGVGVQLPDGRGAVRDADDSDVLSATVMRDGVLVGYVPIVADSTGLDDQETVEVIARTDYDPPQGQRREAPCRLDQPSRRGAACWLGRWKAFAEAEPRTLLSRSSARPTSSVPSAYEGACEGPPIP